MDHFPTFEISGLIEKTSTDRNWNATLTASVNNPPAKEERQFVADCAQFMTDLLEAIKTRTASKLEVGARVITEGRFLPRQNLIPVSSPHANVEVLIDRVILLGKCGEQFDATDLFSRDWIRKRFPLRRGGQCVSSSGGKQGAKKKAPSKRKGAQKGRTTARV